MISQAAKPNIASAALFQDVTTSSKFLPTIASSDDSTMAASLSRASTISCSTAESVLGLIIGKSSDAYPGDQLSTVARLNVLVEKQEEALSKRCAS